MLLWFLSNHGSICRMRALVHLYVSAESRAFLRNATLRYTKTILDRPLLLMLSIHIDAAYKSFEVTTLEMSLLATYLGPLTLGIIRAICLTAAAAFFATSSTCVGIFHFGGIHLET